MKRAESSACPVVCVAAIVFATSGVQGETATASVEALSRIDPALARTQDGDDRAWYDASKLPIEGKGWTDTPGPYGRLPARAEDMVTKSVWGLSRDSAGVCLRFVTDASSISVRWKLRSSSLAMPHMPATGVSGLDLYVRYKHAWHWIGAGRPTEAKNEWKSAPTHVPPGTYEYLLYLPLYNGVESLEIGLPPKASLFRPPAWPGKPVCVYGTSIVQGGCASRPGMAHVAILGRRLNCHMINLGFSGSGKMEPAMATLLAELDVAVYVLDCLPNMTTEMVAERLEPFVASLRKARPDTPIVLVENVIPQGTMFLPKPEQAVTAKNAALRTIYDRLTTAGDRKLYYVSGDALLGGDGEATVDGVHPTDLGFIRMADAIEPILRQLLAGAK